MSDRPLFTNAAALAGADAVGKTIADSGATPALVGHVRLFKSDLVPDAGTTRAQLVAAEVTFTGYPAGGYDIEDFFPSTFAAGGGAVITAPIVNVFYASGDGEMVGGWWLEDDTAPTPLVREVFIYDPVRALQVVGDGWPIAVQLGYGANAS